MWFLAVDAGSICGGKTPSKERAVRTLRRLFPELGPMPPDCRVLGLALHATRKPMIVHRPKAGPRFVMIFFETEAVIGSAAQHRLYPPNQMVIYPPCGEHYFGHPQREWRHSWIAVKGAFVEKQLQQFPIAEVFEISDPSLIQYYLSGIFREVADHAACDEIILRNLFESWTREISRCRRGAGIRRPVPADYSALKQQLLQNFDRPVDLETLARRMHVSRWHLCRRFKAFFGIAPIEYVLSVRLQHSAQLLKDTTLNIAEIARRVGYEDAYHFSKLFKGYYGLSPRQMRKDLWPDQESNK